MTRAKPLFWEYGRKPPAPDSKVLGGFPYPKEPGARSPNLAVREGAWKLLIQDDGTGAELFNLEDDPRETRNRAAEHPDLAGRLAKSALSVAPVSALRPAGYDRASLWLVDAGRPRRARSDVFSLFPRAFCRSRVPPNRLSREFTIPAWKGETMQVQPYLSFEGRCDEAIAFYKSVLGAEVTMLVRFKDHPEPQPPGMIKPESENKIMHVRLQHR